MNMGIGDWGLGIGHNTKTQKINHQYPIPKTQLKIKILYLKKKNY